MLLVLFKINAEIGSIEKMVDHPFCKKKRNNLVREKRDNVPMKRKSTHCTNTYCVHFNIGWFNKNNNYQILDVQSSTLKTKTLNHLCLYNINDIITLDRWHNT